MTSLMRQHPLAMKLARIALVFMLVFWSSLRVEYLVAFGAVTGDDGTAEQGALEDLSVLKVNGAGDVVDRDALVTASGTQRALANKTPLVNVDMDADSDPLYLIASPSWSSPASSDARKALFVDWESDDPAVVSVRQTDGVAALTPQAAGSAVVTCSLKSGFSSPLGDEFASRPCEVRFVVNVAASEPEQAVPQVNAFQILDATGSAVSSDAVLNLAESQRGSYPLGATLVAVDSVSGDPLVEFTHEPGSAADGLEAASGGLLANLSWELVGEDGAAVDESVASISAEGVLSMHADAAFKVVCNTWYAPSAERSPAWSAAVHVTSGDVGASEEDLQGAAHPQDSLHVYANLGSAKQKDAQDESASDGEADAEPDGAEAAEAPSDEAQGGAESGEGPGSASPTAENVIVEKTYGLDELQSIPSGTETYTMYGSKGVTTVTGTGPYLVALLQDAGIPDDRFEDIESLSVTDYRGVTTKVSWDDLMRPRSYFPSAEKGSYADGRTTTPMVAVSSYVNEEGDEGAADGSKLLDNTRFRLLFGATNPPSASIDPLSLRSINDIVVNMKGAVPDKNNDVFTVRVEYVPVPLGVMSVFSAIPSRSIGTARFDFQWQESVDGGKSWTDCENGAVQTLRRMTNSENMGKSYRVILDSNIPDEANEGEFLSATSEPVEMEAGDGFAVVLAYDPPIAGGTAIFQSSVLGGIDPGTVEYVWEMSDDGGASWQVIPNRTGPSLAIPTEPIDESEDSSDEDSGAGLIYIRVRAIAPGDLIAVSNAQPLTVHVGDENADAGGADDDGRADGDDEPNAGEKPADDRQPSPGQSGQSTPRVTEISNVVIEQPSSASAASVTPDGDRTAANAAPTEIYINQQVSDQVAEQVAEQQERIEATVPGARWTSLNTVDPSGDDVRRILSDNPFAPLVVPFGLGVTAAGGVEKLVAFRRQTK